jgi:hypothetical protein
MAIAGYYYMVELYATEQYTSEDNVGEGFPNTYYRVNGTPSLNVDQKLVYRVFIVKGNNPPPNPTVIFKVRDDGKLSDGSTVANLNGARLPGDGVFATWKTKIADTASVSSIRTINDRNFDFTITAKKGGNVQPVLNPQVRVNGIWQDVAIRSGDKVPTVTFTKSAKPPAKGIPTTVTADDYKINGITQPGSQRGPIEWNACKKYWVRYWRQGVKYVPGGPDSLKNPAYYEYTVQVKYFDSDGNPLDPTVRTFGKERTKNGGFYKKNSPSQQALKILNEAKNCAAPNTGGGGGADTSPGPTPPSVTRAQNFNPYPHISTRHFSAREDTESITYENANKYDQLASFYVDPEIIDLPDKKQAEFATTSAANLDKLWGFRFLFNPSYISINMSSNNKVDWTRPNENGAALVADGIGGTISVNILLDRVADMVTMKQWKKNGGGPFLSSSYPVLMDAEQCAGILHRGTEYDLEYLFRVVNGNPQKVILMGESPKDGLELLSANMGYMTQLPFIFKISERQRYKVIMESINIEHSMFTRDMIPIRTVVQIGLQRLPDLASGNFKKFKQAESINKITQVIKNTSSSDIIAARKQRDGFI